jgi:hypothetical protein
VGTLPDGQLRHVLRCRREGRRKEESCFLVELPSTSAFNGRGHGFRSRNTSNLRTFTGLRVLLACGAPVHERGEPRAAPRGPPLGSRGMSTAQPTSLPGMRVAGARTRTSCADADVDKLAGETGCRRADAEELCGRGQEYNRSVTLRFLYRLSEPEVLEPVVPSVFANLEHGHHFIRRHDVSAVSTIYRLPISSSPTRQSLSSGSSHLSRTRPRGGTHSSCSVPAHRTAPSPTCSPTSWVERVVEASGEGHRRQRGKSRRRWRGLLEV